MPLYEKYFKDDKVLDSNVATKMAPSYKYFVVLFRSCGLYLSISALLSIPIALWGFIIALMVLLYVLHVSFSAIQVFYYVALGGLVSRSKVYARKFWAYFHLLKSPLSRKFAPKSKLSKTEQIKTEMKGSKEKIEVFHQKAESLVVSLILLVSILGSILFLIFLSVQTIHETSSFLDRSLVFVNSTLINHPSLKDVDYREHINTAVDKGSQWADEQLFLYFPGNKISSKEIYLKAKEFYGFVFDPVYSMSFIGPLPKNPLEGDESSSRIRAHFPYVSQIIQQFRSGETFDTLSSISPGTLYNEVRLGVPEILRTFFNFDEEALKRVINNTSDYFTIFAEQILNNSPIFLGYLSYILFSAFSLVTFGFSLLAELILFVTILSFLLGHPKSPIEHIGFVLEFLDTNHVLEKSIEKSLSAIFLTTGKLFLFHFLLTWLTFNLVGFPFVYISALISGFLAIVPIINPLIILIIPLIDLYYSASYFSLIFLSITHIFCWWTIDASIYSDIPDSHPYVSSLSIVLGLYSFGLQGIIIGPLLACLPVIGYHLFTIVQKS